MGYRTDGDYMIDPDGFVMGDVPVQVSCNMTGRNGQASTIVSHDSEARTHVKGYEGRLTYVKNVGYNMTKSQLSSLLKLSDHCEQFIQYECYGSVFRMFRPPIVYNVGGVWESFRGEKMYYWGGAMPGSQMCACGMTKTCIRRDRKCNCDSNIAEWNSDEGYLTDKESLPVTKMYFGDTGATGEQGYHTLGKLICYGKQI